jgi:hypothetical protein
LPLGRGVMVKGVQKSFREEIDTSSMSPVARQGVARLGQVGYITKGVAPGRGGGLLGYGALTSTGRRRRGSTPRGRRSWGAAVREVSGHGGGAGIRGLRPVRDSPVAIPPDVAQQHHVHGRSRLRCVALIMAFRAMWLAVAPAAMPIGGQSARCAMWLSAPGAIAGITPIAGVGRTRGSAGSSPAGPRSTSSHSGAYCRR